MECADPLPSPESIVAWVQAGVRAVGPAHYGPNVYAHGTGAPGGLTQGGRRLLQLMDALGVVLDTSHLSERAFWEALDGFSGPVMASHSNCRALVPGDRQLDDAQLRQVIQREGVVGIALETGMLEGRPAGTGRVGVGVDDVVRHIDHVCQLAGSARHVGLGTDLDGGFGRERIPEGLDSAADLPRLRDALLAKGYSREDADLVMYGNWLRFWQRALPV